MLTLPGVLLAEDHELSLEDTTRAVLLGNPAIRQRCAKWEAAKAGVPQAAAWDDLKVSANSRVARFVPMMPNQMPDQEVMMEQMLPISGKNLVRARIAETEAWIAFQDLRRQQLDAVFKTRASYLHLANAYAQLDLVRQNLVSLRQFAEISRAKYAVGNQMQTDVLLAETELARLTETQRDLERTISNEHASLNALMGRDPFVSLGFPEPVKLTTMPHTVAHLRELILQNRPELKIASAHLNAEKARLQLAQREWIPDPSVSARAMRYNAASQTVSELDAGISFNVPWLNPGKYAAGERAARREVEAARDDAERLQIEALALLRDQLVKIETLHHHYEIFTEKIIPQSRQTVEATQLGYESNKSGFLDLISAQRNLREVQAAALEHLTEYERALAELEAIVGTELHVFPCGEMKTKGAGK